MLRQAVEAKVKAAGLAIFLKYILPILLVIGLILGLVFTIIILMDAWLGEEAPESGFNDIGNVSAEVLAYQPVVERYAKEYGIENHVPIILAMMMQESGGRGNDPMQASESLCGRVGCISDPELSIKQGVKYFAQQLKRSKGDTRLAIQGYNFGGGFIGYVLERGGKYTFDLAVNFSRMMYEKLKGTGNYSCIRPNAPAGACYGDVYYVDSVLAYVSYTEIGGSGQWQTPIAGGLQVNSPFGARIDPVTGTRSIHKGVDFGCIGGVTPIQAVDHGRVVYSEFNNGGYGNTVIIQHGKNLFSHYAHMSSRKVQNGQVVKPGQQVGICGSTGKSTGPHLHFEAKSAIWEGHSDPMKLLH